MVCVVNHIGLWIGLCSIYLNKNFQKDAVAVWRCVFFVARAAGLWYAVEKFSQMSVQAHHSFMNGLHIGLFAEKLQAYLDEC